MEFEKAHQLLLEQHLSVRAGERRGRLIRGHQYAEKLLLQNIWWPLFGNLDHLHPEYEVYDWNRKLSHNFSISRFYRRTGNSVSNVMVIRAM